MILKRIIKPFSIFLFPSFCGGCRRRLAHGEKNLCTFCLSSLPVLIESGAPENELEYKLIGNFKFYRAVAFCLFEQNNVLQQVIHTIKYYRNKSLAYDMGVLCANYFKDRNFFDNIDYLIPIPLHPDKERQRGFNQASEICKGIALVTQIPINETAFRRVINSKSQTRYKRDIRKGNVQNVFECMSPSSLNNKHVLFVDDIVTTGATLTNLATSIPPGISVRISIIALGDAR